MARPPFSILASIPASIPVSILAPRLLAPLLLAAAASAQHVWVVDDDPGPGVDFQRIQEAVNAADDFDRILVKEGVYPGFTVDDLVLVVCAERDERVEIRGEVLITGLGGGKRLLLRGLHTPQDPTLAPDDYFTLAAVANVGHLWVEDCTLGRPPGNGTVRPLLRSAPVRLWGMTAAVLVRSTLMGGTDPATGLGGPALANAGFSNTYLYDCTLEGGAGNPVVATQAAREGGPGILMEGGFVFAGGCTIRGGPGGDGGPRAGSCGDGAAGGPGMSLGGLLPALDLLETQPAGGAGGNSTCGQAGAPGPSLEDPFDALVQTFPAQVRHISSASPVRTDEGAELTIHGLPGDSWLMVAQVVPDKDYVPAYFGPFLVAQPYATLAQGELPPSGTVQVPLGLVGITDPLRITAQVVVLEEAGQVVLGSGTSFLVLPAGF